MNNLIANLKEFQKELPGFQDELNRNVAPEKAAEVNEIIDELKTLTDKPPFYFDDSMRFSYLGGIMALGRAINELLGDQQEILASNMGISNGLVSTEISKWSDQWLHQLQKDQDAINKLTSKSTGAEIAQAQGQLSLDNAASTASSTGLNGVMNMITQAVSSKTSTYQNLVQQSNQVVTSLLSFMAQVWVI